MSNGCYLQNCTSLLKGGSKLEILKQINPTTFNITQVGTGYIAIINSKTGLPTNQIIFRLKLNCTRGINGTTITEGYKIDMSAQ